ncbi:hypothetical protein HRbin17_02363 [bacterium HR17]|uniref:Uncharacterized protein n=1 Tax=Candidatus Fervidibacter japonicus TaxID=2035412 RepID=A0A2H5XF81_9BACT|nr:hypothetical protein HRbin17_02363 [bacterium HR17]
MRRWVIGFAIVGLTVLIATFWHLSGLRVRQHQLSQNFIAAAKAGKDPEAVARVFLLAIKVGDFDLAHQLLDKSSRRKVTPSQLASLLIMPNGNTVRVRQIRSVKVTRKSPNRVFADFIVTLDGLSKVDIPILNQHTVPMPPFLQRFSFGESLWRKLISNLPAIFNTAPKGGFVELSLTGSGIGIIWSSRSWRHPPVSTRPHFFFRRYELVLEDGKWRIANAIAP